MDNLIIEHYRALAFITSISMKLSLLKLYRLIRHRRGDRISHSVMLKLVPSPSNSNHFNIGAVHFPCGCAATFPPKDV